MQRKVKEPEAEKAKVAWKGREQMAQVAMVEGTQRTMETATKVRVLLTRPHHRQFQSHQLGHLRPLSLSLPRCRHAAFRNDNSDASKLYSSIFHLVQISLSETVSLNGSMAMRVVDECD